MLQGATYFKDKKRLNTLFVSGSSGGGTAGLGADPSLSEFGNKSRV
jgi:hypothetical protein